MNFLDNKQCDLSQPITLKKAEINVFLRFINNRYEIQVLPLNFPGNNIIGRPTATNIQILNISPTFSPLGLTVWGKQYTFDVKTQTYIESDNYRLVAVPTTTTFGVSLTKNPSNNTLTLDINTGAISNTSLINFGVTETVTNDPNVRTNSGLRWMSTSRLISKIVFLYDDKCDIRESFSIGVF